MTIKGFDKMSLVDYPSHVACVLFLAGCNLRCGYCYNHKLFVNSDRLPTINEEYIHAFIKSRKNILEGICISGGEPTVQLDLPMLIQRLKKHGLPIKLDTNGTNPEMINKIIQNKLVDYIALDIKAPLSSDYSKLTGAETNLIENIQKTLHLLSIANITFELRTTIIPTIHSMKMIKTMREGVAKSFGSHLERTAFTWFLQSFLPINCLKDRFNTINRTTRQQLEFVAEELKNYFPNVVIRS